MDGPEGTIVLLSVFLTIGAVIVLWQHFKINSLIERARRLNARLMARDPNDINRYPEDYG
jgi:hypothetical protein